LFSIGAYVHDTGKKDLKQDFVIWQMYWTMICVIIVMIYMKILHERLKETVIHMDSDIFTPSDFCIMATTYKEDWFTTNEETNNNKKVKEIKRNLINYLIEKYKVKKENIVTSNVSRKINNYY
jgi:hypothetical protein